MGSVGLPSGLPPFEERPSLRMPSAAAAVMRSLRVRWLRSLHCLWGDDFLGTRQGSLIACTLHGGSGPLPCGNKHRRPSISNSAAIVLQALRVAVVAGRLLPLVAESSPPVRHLEVQLVSSVNDPETVACK